MMCVVWFRQFLCPLIIVWWWYIGGRFGVFCSSYLVGIAYTGHNRFVNKLTWVYFVNPTNLAIDHPPYSLLIFGAGFAVRAVLPSAVVATWSFPALLLFLIVALTTSAAYWWCPCKLAPLGCVSPHLAVSAFLWCWYVWGQLVPPVHYKDSFGLCGLFKSYVQLVVFPLGYMLDFKVWIVSLDLSR